MISAPLKVKVGDPCKRKSDCNSEWQGQVECINAKCKRLESEKKGWNMYGIFVIGILLANETIQAIELFIHIMFRMVVESKNRFQKCLTSVFKIF